LLSVTVERGLPCSLFRTCFAIPSAHAESHASIRARRED
jgi:hypothetical protein